ncbi:MAG: hypothetical protein COA74_15045 [Gammaproteobacteria bacterium]|nr:MAG: hypothetical protein COA74_15045 [Gammaproteobacteria bacterium]
MYPAPSVNWLVVMIPETLEKIADFKPNTPLLKLDDSWLEPYDISLYIKRDDLIDNIISGNKFRKLKYSLSQYESSNYAGIVSFGGPWSNHLHALASLAKLYKIPLVTIIRGEKPPVLSDMLSDIIEAGAEVHYVSRVDYKDCRDALERGNLKQHSLIKQWKNYLVIPEGGATNNALAGVAEILTENDQVFDAIYLACGTATTLAGLSIGLPNNSVTKIIGIAALKAGNSLEHSVQRLLKENGVLTSEQKNWVIDHQFHFGGFAKVKPELLEFMKGLFERTQLITEPVYTGKTLYALYHHIEEGYFTPGSQIMMLHSGGLQGLRGYKDMGINEMINKSMTLGVTS